MQEGGIILTPEQCSDKHTREFYAKHGDVCAVKRVNLRQMLFFGLLGLLLALLYLRDAKVAFTLLTFALCGFYGAVILFRLFSVMLALIFRHEHRVSADELAALKDEDLPVYTVLVPMYKEPEVAQKIARTVTSLDYPLDKLDVKLLLEEDDLATRQKIDEVLGQLPPCVEVVIAPVVTKGQPRTKPRACNWGLEKARGQYLVIFDAEDQPERDQLKKAVAAFRKLEAAGKHKVVCLQAKLNYFNARQNWLTQFFTLEYTNWFDVFLPGLHAVRTPIPLGGTSNHFKTDVLREIGGWDPFNVTEDCDLGLRLARKGRSTEILDSTTWEEANSHTGNWIRQRSRWIKGYYQTHLVHTRDAVVPPILLGLVFVWLARKLGMDLTDPTLSTDLVGSVKVMWGVAWGGAAASFLAAAYSVIARIAQRAKGSAEGQLGPWSALTVRFTVGGQSMMLLLNLFFWMMAGAYLMREPIAHSLPAPVARLRLPGETVTLKESLLAWKLYHTEVTDEVRYSNVTFWNTVSGYVSGTVSSQEAGERIRAVDTWSLISQLFYPIAVTLFMANFIFVLLGLVSCHKRRLWDLFPFALLMPVYWVLISIAAVKGFWQLFVNPWYWEKTTHGLTSSTPPASLPPGPTQGSAHAPAQA